MEKSSEYSYDAVIAYAAKDRTIVKKYLIEPLKKEGTTIWDYEQDIKLGDSMINSISQALTKARYGIVFISPNLMGDKWSGEMYKSLLNLDQPNRKVFLPIWYKFDYTAILREFPILADRKPALVSQGWDDVHQKLIQLISSREARPEILAELSRIKESDDDSVAPNIQMNQNAKSIKNIITGDNSNIGTINL